ncbi:DNA double-strand break repair nuclease NurA [Candidatus Micrarchaeota archaeon]|nr:DNA double-strand break repair nuclease NurA [Candidatus Micrarchaeota archaeon]
MHWSGSSISRIVSNMQEMREKCASTCLALKKNKDALLVQDVPVNSFSGTVAAVDSGFSSKSFVSLDVLLVRSVATIFYYRENELVSCCYFPSRVPGIDVSHALLSEGESNWFKSLSRLSAELACAVQVAKVHSPSLLLVDGSLLPHPSDKPSQASSLYTDYLHVCSLFEELVSTCGERLVGIVKDSRSQKLCNALKTEFGVSLPPSDEFVADCLLDNNQRTKCFSVSDPDSSVHCFYMKAGALPFRVEFVSRSPEETASRIAGSLAPLSSRFGYPAVLIEADMRAALTPGEIGAVFDSLESRARSFLLRKDSRPFRW